MSDGEHSDFKDIDTMELKTGSLIFKDIVGAVDCKIVKTVDAGDHVVFIGEVLDCVLKDGESLSFSKEVFP